MGPASLRDETVLLLGNDYCRVCFAQEVEQYDRSTELEVIGGRMLEQSVKEWAELAEAA